MAHVTTLIIFVGLAALGIALTIRALITDGYRRVPARMHESHLEVRDEPPPSGAQPSLLP